MRVRHLEIRNFRGIKELSWFPAPGINCLIGRGDVGKSTVLDALDMLLGARRNVSFTDADFHALVVDDPIEITATMGELDADLKSLEAYGHYLRGFDAVTDTIHDEPTTGCEVVLTVRLTVGSDLEPLWTLHSERRVDELPRYLTWKDRVRLSPTRIGTQAQQHLGWRKGSVLNKLSDERADASEALADASRQARLSFGDISDDQFTKTLDIVAKTASYLGVPARGKLKAMLDPESVSFGGGTISVHDEAGVPLSLMGAGSTRLLVAGLQREAAAGATVVLVDELEFGLDPQRILRLISSLGAKESPPPIQAFVTTHSPVAIRELTHAELSLLRYAEGVHYVVGLPAESQGTLRAYPEAFLATSVIVCEGATEVGFIRGIDRFLVSKGRESIFAKGVALVDAGGCSKIYGRATPFLSLGFRVSVLRDDDVRPKADEEEAFEEGGAVFNWRDEQSIEDELFRSLESDAVLRLLDCAIEHHGAKVEEQIKSASNGTLLLEECRADLNEAARGVLATAANKGSWFKQIGLMEDATYEIIAPAIAAADPAFKNVVARLVEWMADGPR